MDRNLTSKATSRNLARHFHILRRPALWMVSVIYCYPLIYLIFPPQHSRMAQNPAFLAPVGLPPLHHLVDLRAAFLDRRGMVELRVLQPVRCRI